MSGILLKGYHTASDDMEKLVRKHGKKLLILDYITAIFQRIITFDGLYLSYQLYKVYVLHAFSYGTLIALYNSSNRLKSSIDRFTNIFTSFQQHSIYIEKLRTFLESKNDLSDDGQKEVSEFNGLKLDDVSFFIQEMRRNRLKR